MKKLLLSISFIVCFFAGFSQSIVQRSTGANTLNDPNLFTSKSFRPPVFADTAAANAVVSLDSCGKIIFTYDVMSIWTRACSPKRWERVGGAISFANSPSITFSGTGASTDPVIADVNISPQAGNSIQSTGQGLYVPMFVQDGLIQPGAITWINNYNYDVSPAIGVIGGVRYTSDWTPISLATADPLLDRIDVVAFNAGGTITVITGTPADDPQKPIVDPATQLELGFILVTANTTAPPTPPNQDWIYENYITNAWTTLSSTVRINDQSTSIPYSVPTNVVATAAQNGDNIRFTSVSAPTIANFNIVTLKILSTTIWANDSRIDLQWYNGATPVGSPVAIANNNFGFTSTNLSTYQIVSIALNQFGSLPNVTALLITVSTTGGRTISFHVDDIQLQSGILPTIGYTADNAITLTGNNFQLGGSLIKNTSITTGPYFLGLTGSLASPNAIYRVTNTGTGNSILGVAVSGTAVSGTSTSGNALLGISSSAYGVIGISTTGHGGGFMNSNSSGNTVQTALSVQRNTFGAPSAGYGTAIDFLLSGTAFPALANLRSNRIVSTWTNATTLSQTSQLVITGTDAAVESDLITLSGNGQLKFNKYVTGAFTSGTATQYLATTSDGTVIQVSPTGISGITADNGLTANTATNVRLGGSLLGHTIIQNGVSRMSFAGATPFADTAIIVATNTASAGRAIFAGTTSSVSFPIWAETSGGSATGVYSVANGTGLPGNFVSNPSSTNTYSTGLMVTRTSTGTPANGIGGTIEFWLENNIGGIDEATQLVSTYTDAAGGSRKARFEIWNVHNTVLARKFAIASTGAITADGYGTGAITGTPAYTLQVDASGNIIEGSVAGGGLVTADNGLTATGSNVQLGGTLLANTGIATGAFTLALSTSTALSTPLTSTATTGNAVTGTATTGIGIAGNSQGTGNATGQFQNTGGGIAGRFIGNGTTVLWAETNSSSTNTVIRTILFDRKTSGTAADGIGNSIDIGNEKSDGNTSVSTQLISKWTIATNTLETSQFIITGVNGAITGDILTLNGNKTIKANGYGTGGITGTAAFALAVDATGNIIEIALGGGGGGTVNSVAGTLNRITSTGGTDPIIDISASYVGQTSITTLGTVATGVWNGTAIGDTYISSATTWNAKQTGDATLTALAGLTITNGSLIYGTGADAFAVLAAGSNGQVLMLTAGVPSWVTPGTGGTVSNITGVTANGFAWSIANPTTTPALTLSVSVTGILKGNGTAISAAVAGTDYLTPTGSAALLTSFPTFNQNTTGSAATLTTPRNINGVAFNGSADITVTAAAGTLSGTTLNSSVVSSSLTSVGTITSGTWQGTAIGLGFGGTGLTSGGSGNQILGMNAAGNASQYKTLSSSNGITITHSVGGIAIANTFNPAWQTLTDGATITWNVTNGGNARVTLTGTGRTLTITNPVDGYTYMIRIIQGSGGSKTITTWPTGTVWQDGVDPGLSTTAGDWDVVQLTYDATSGIYIGTFGNDFN